MRIINDEIVILFCTEVDFLLSLSVLYVEDRIVIVVTSVFSQKAKENKGFVSNGNRSIGNQFCPSK